MKKLILSIVFGCFILSAIMGVAVSSTNAKDDMDNKGTIYINDVEINSEDTVLINDNELFIPLRTVFEALDSTVIWEESTGNIYFDYAGIDFVCKFVALNSYFPEQKNILICTAENKDSTKNSDYIQLNPMSAGGTYRIINDRTYLNQQTGQRLFEALGCKVNIDLEQKILRISNFANDYQPEAGDVTVYDLNANAFERFLQSPSIEYVSNQCDSLSVYRKHISKDGYIQRELYNQKGHVDDETKSGIYRAGSWPIYTEFIDFMNDSENFRKILLDHDINDNILSHIIITHSQYNTDDDTPVPPGTYPIMCIWVHTDKGDYFLEFNAYLYEDPHDTTFRFDFYDLPEYLKKYGTD